jgi:hypothetical protein
MGNVEKEVFLIDKFDLAVIRKQPIFGPGIQKYKRVARIDKLRLIWNDHSGLRNHALDCERMLLAEIGIELRIGNMCALSGRAGRLFLG